MKIRCTQHLAGHQETSCGAVATFRIRFVREGSGKEVLGQWVCARHLAKAVRTASEHLHESYPDVQVRALE